MSKNEIKTIKTLIIFLTLIILGIIQIIFIKEAQALTVNELRKKFPNGKYWNHPAGQDHYYQYGIIDQGKCNNPDGWTNSPCNAHNGTTASFGKNDCNSFDRAQQCTGFARKLFFDYYGTYATSVKIHTNINNLKPGDILRYKRGNSGGHDVWIIGINGDNITVAECNWGDRCIISWDRTFSKSSITVEKIYSAPRALTDGKDLEPPVITEGYVDMSSISQNGYKIIARVTDNTGVEKVLFPTWTNKNGQDDIIWKAGTYNAQINAWEFWVKKSEHNNELDLYNTHIYAYDTSGNSSFKTLSAIPMGGLVANLGSFNARIVLNKDSNYVVGVNNSNVVLKIKNNSDNSQIWKFTRNNDGSYYIENTSNGTALDVLNGTRKKW